MISMGIDSFEYESFSEELQDRFGRGFPEAMDDSWTLGDIFKHVTETK